MKRVIPKLLLLFCLIPWGVSMLFTIVDCVFNLMYLDWLWIPDWCMVIFNMLSYYMIELTAFAMFGVFAYYVFYGKAYKAVILAVLSLAASVLFPLSRYFIGHMLLTDVLYDTAMLVYYNENWLFAQTLLMNAILFLLAVLLTKLFAGILFGMRLEMPKKALSLRNPLNLAALLFCSAAVVMATVLFVFSAVYSFDGILSLLVEYLINAVRFFVIVFTAFFVGKKAESAKQAA